MSLSINVSNALLSRAITLQLHLNKKMPIFLSSCWAVCLLVLTAGRLGWGLQDPHDLRGVSVICSVEGWGGLWSLVPRR